MHFIGAIVDPCTALVSVPEGEERIVRDSQGTVNLNGPIDYFHEHIGHEKFDG
jgi:hypothetical protein